MNNSFAYNNYRLKNMILKEQNKIVYLAEHENLELKCIVKAAKSGTGEAQQIKREAKVLVSVNSPFIPRFYSFEEVDGFIVLAEEYIEGPRLLDYLSETFGISGQEFQRLAVSLLDGLIALHEGSEVYVCCDIKPENIIVSAKGLCIVDFGAAVKEGRQSMTEPSYGTAGFAAPEQLCGEMRTAATDVYAAGQVLELLLAKVSGLSPAERKRTEGIIDRATEPNPGLRQRTVRELKEEILAGAKKRRKQHGCVTIGLIGTHSGVGTSHLALQLGSFFGSRGEKVVLADLSGSGGLACLNDEAGDERSGPFTVRGLTVYPDGAYFLNKLMKNASFDRCILDFGCGVTNNLLQLKACDLKLIITDASPFRRDRRLMVDRLCVHAGVRNGWRLLVNLSDRARLKELRHLPINTEWTGFSPDPFKPEEQNVKLFKKLLSEV